MDKLSASESARYSRHFSLEGFGVPAQLRLKASKVLVVGAGGLGSPILSYLAAAGVGTLGIVDDDKIELSNLQRQILFTTSDVGKLKAEVAAARLLSMNSHVSCIVHPIRLHASNALSVIADFDLVIDGSDNFQTRYLLNDACVLLEKPLISGSILRFEGQVGVFNHLLANGKRSATYRDLFPTPPDPATVQSCEQAGVLGVLPGLIGSIQAGEAIKIITGVGDPLVNKLLIIDMLTMEQMIIKVADRGERERVKALIDYEDFCGISREKSKSLIANQNTNMKEITVQELKKMKDSGADFQLIDVREPHEYDICHIDGELIPMSEIPYNVDKISKDRQVVIHCRSGKRSGDMLLWLEKNHGFSNLYNLKGGILAWAKEIDPSMPTY